jgi:hypothetical protein
MTIDYRPGGSDSGFVVNPNLNATAAASSRLRA